MKIEFDFLSKFYDIASLYLGDKYDNTYPPMRIRDDNTNTIFQCNMDIHIF